MTFRDFSWGDDSAESGSWRPSELGRSAHEQRYVVKFETDFHLSESGSKSSSGYKRSAKGPEKKLAAVEIYCWIPSEWLMILLGSSIALIAFLGRLAMDEWAPEFLWMSIILGLFAVSVRSQK